MQDLHLVLIDGHVRWERLIRVEDEDGSEYWAVNEGEVERFDFRIARDWLPYWAAKCN